MKEKCTTLIAASLLLVGTASLPMLAWSMDEMSDGQLSATTGQSGVTLSVAPKVVAGVPTIPIGNIVYADKDGFTGNANPGSLRTDLTKVQFFGSATTSTDSLGNVSNTGALGVGTAAYSAIKLVIDATGGGVSTATTGSNPTLFASLKMPNVRTISTFFNNVNGWGTGNLLGLIGGSVALRAADPAGRLAASSTSIVPILSVGTYAAASATVPQLNINLASDIQIDIRVGKPTGNLITLTSLNISSLDFNGQPLNFESPNAASGFGAVACSTTAAASGCASRLSVTPSVRNLNLSNGTVDVYNAAGFNAQMGTSGTTGGLVFQAAPSAIGMDVALNDVTAGTIGNTDSGFAAGMKNAPMGSFGMTGVIVSNLKIGVSGM